MAIAGSEQFPEACFVRCARLSGVECVVSGERGRSRAGESGGAVAVAVTAAGTAGKVGAATGISGDGGRGNGGNDDDGDDDGDEGVRVLVAAANTWGR